MVAAVAATSGAAAASADGCVIVFASAYNGRRSAGVRKIFDAPVTAVVTV